MNITEIKDPTFLKDLSIIELNDLALDIRQFLINSVSKTGGHLASNLGVVELTIALHYVFDSPRDKIFFDVGHQCYTHKVLTGRAKEFSTLRQYDGISGFQKRKESSHDVWEAGHSSTSLSAALGMAVTRDLQHEDYAVVPVIGDGAIASGMAMDALNSIGSEQKKMIIIFNDNNMSISKNVGAMSKGFARLRSAKSYNSLKQNMKSVLKKNELGKLMYSGMKSFKDAIKESVIDKGIFGEFNLEYMGPVDGHNLTDLIRVLKVAQEHDGPVVVHVITQKGHGYSPCEKDLDGNWHGVGPFNVETGLPLKHTPLGFKKWSSLISDTLVELAEHDPRIVVLTPAMINGSALETFFAKFPNRSFDCGIAEEHALTFAAGLAISDYKPFISIYSSFLQRGYDQINHDICRMDLPVVIGIDRAGIVGEDGDTHHGLFDIGMLRPIPNIILSQPKDAKEARDLLYTAFNQKHPFALRYPRGEIKEHMTSFDEIEIGTWPIFNETSTTKGYILTYGEDVDRLLEKITVNQIDLAVVNCRFFKPLDENCIAHLSKQNKPIFVYETDMLAGGLSSAILEYSNDINIELKMKRYGIGDHYVGQGSTNLLRKDQFIDMNYVLDDILKEI
ncbi:MAG: 1-deoxy-D-xylulose-5-phosphate synthase [Solobacterium sp.]|nr:1-deoxy-D-xylulose-5-phosphate synthase [Solobacterium sp.]